MRISKILMVIIPALLITAPGIILSDNKSPVDINWQVVSTGGTMSHAIKYRLGGTIGQTAIGPAVSLQYNLNSGFWENLGEAGICDCRPGDANGNVTINILDITYLIDFIYKGGPAPVPYALCSGDPNGDCTINILDITYLIKYVYQGGTPPVTCQKWVDNCGAPLRK